jgi:3-(3-hydroxy-phenyl)propionate hydroxylase
MMQMSERLGLITSVANLPHAIAIEVILTVASSIPPLARFLREAKFRPVPRLTGGFRWNSGRKDSRAGELLRQPTVQRTTGEAIPLDGLLGDHFTVLGVGSHGLGRPALDAWTRWGARYAHVGAANAECYVPERADDTALALKEWLGNVEDRFLLIRPDRYIAADFCARETRAVLEAVQRLLPSCESTAH